MCSPRSRRCRRCTHATRTGPASEPRTFASKTASGLRTLRRERRSLVRQGLRSTKPRLCASRRAHDAAAPEPLVLLNLTLRMKSEIAADAETAKRLVAEADALRQQAAALRQQQGPRPAPPLLDATVEPPLFPSPGPPPPPPPR